MKVSGASQTVGTASRGCKRGVAPYLTVTAGVGAIALGFVALSLNSAAGAATPPALPQSPVVVDQARVVVAKTATTAPKHPQVVGHRGGSRWGTESTMSNMRHANKIGADGVEFDIRFTSDGIPVLMHDRTVDRTTSCAGLITEISLKALKKCAVSVPVVGDLLPGERVPTLAEAIAELSKTKLKVYVHVKSAQPAEAKAVVKILNKYKMNKTSGPTNRTVVMADNPGNAEKLKKAGAKRLGLVIDRADEWDAPFQVIVARGTPVTTKIVKKAHKEGKFVVAVEGWPVKSSQARGLGVDGFMADDLDAAVENLGTIVTRAAAG